MHYPLRLGIVLVVSSLSSLAVNVGEVRETGLAPAVSVPLTDLSRDLAVSSASINVDLRARFTILGVNPDQLIQISTSEGTFNAELLVADAPLTVANFKSYLATDSTPVTSLATTYDNTIFDRSVFDSVIQGGAFKNNGVLAALTAKAPVVDEFKVANTRGTIAMQKRGGLPDSATNQWFVNLADNSSVFDNENGGYTAFARVLGAGMTTVDAIAALPTHNLTDSEDYKDFFLNEHPQGTSFRQVPLIDYDGETGLLPSHFVTIHSIRSLPLQPPATGSGGSVLTYTVTNDNPGVAEAVITNGNLKVKPQKFAGRSVITVRASEAGGAFAESSFTLERVGPLAIFDKLPATTTAQLGVNLTLPAAVTGLPIPAVQWQRRPVGGDWSDIPADNTTDLFSLDTASGLAIRLDGTSEADTSAALALDRNQFRYIATQANEGATLTVTSAVTTLRVTKTLAFTKKLAATTKVDFGDTVTLSVATKEATFPAASFKWQSKAPGTDTWIDLANTTTEAPTPYSGVTTASLTIDLTGTGVAAARFARDLDRTRFRCVIDNGLGSLAGSPTTLRVKTPAVGFSAQPPALASGPVDGSATISVTSLAFADNTPITYKWERLPAGAEPATGWIALVDSNTEAPTRYTGVATNTLTISLAGADDAARQAALALNGDQYRCVIKNDLDEATSKVTTLRVVAGQATLVTSENISLPGLIATEDRTFSALGLPAGLTMDATTGRVTGITTAKPGVYPITVTITQAEAEPATTTKTYLFEVLALSGTNAGGFEALLSAGDLLPRAKLAITINGTGVLSGTLTTTIDKKPLAFKASVARSPAGVLTLAAPIQITGRNGGDGSVYLLTDLSISVTGVLSVKLQTRANADATPVEIAAATSVIVESVETGNPGVHLASYTTANPAPWATMEAFTLGLTDPASLETVGEDETATAIPVGSGYARAPINAKGLLKIAGKLPDGAPFTASAATGADASYRIFARPYAAAPGAFFSADFKLSATSVYSPVTGLEFDRYALAAGSGEDVFWMRPAGIAKPAAYSGGVGLVGLGLQVQPWLFFNRTNLGFKFAADGQSATLGATYTGPTLTAASLPTLLEVKRTNFKLTADTQPDISKLVIRAQQSTGVFTGSLVLADARKVLIEGVFLVPSNLRNHELSGGTVTAEGFALIPDAAGGAPTTERIRLYQPDAVATP